MLAEKNSFCTTVALSISHALHILSPKILHEIDFLSNKKFADGFTCLSPFLPFYFSPFFTSNFITINVKYIAG